MVSFRTVRLALLGFGNVGRALLRQVLQTRDGLERRAGLRLDPVALSDVSGALVDADGFSDERLSASLHAAHEGRLLEALPGRGPLGDLDRVLDGGVILADVTASPRTAERILLCLESGGAVALANKIPLAGDWADARPLYDSPRLRYEVTVGAGLPVIATLQYLLDVGDVVTSIQGCLSGTLGYLCSELERGVPFSAAIEEALGLGYTEPDPREDLGGKDVARKALILARTAGWPLEPSDFDVEALYPQDLAGLPVADYVSAMHTQDAAFVERFAAARDGGKTLRYIARIGPGGGSVGLRSVPRDSALGALHGPGNYVAIHTQRYAEIPLVVAGPGAGPEVTAAGVLGDIIRLARET